MRTDDDAGRRSPCSSSRQGRTRLAWLAGALVYGAALGAQTQADAAERPNVLLIAIDDLNDWVGVLQGHPQARTPHIDRLARRGALFANAHCQAPVCNPSRVSLLLGLRPSRTGVYLNNARFRATPGLKDRITLPQYFRERGYLTAATGKVFHGSRHDPASFEIDGPRLGQRQPQDKIQVPEAARTHRLWDFGPQAYPEAEFSDRRSADWAADFLAQERDRPFFLAVGFYRPHVPLYAPPRFFEERPRASVRLPDVWSADRDDLPSAALQLTANPTPPAHEWFVASDQWRPAVRAYLAATTFMDAQVGRVVDALAASPHAGNTIVVLFSDHGFHLGEKQRWAKQSLWERSTRVPLIIVDPGRPAQPACERPVELLSLYPTLIDLCGLPARRDLDGVSLRPLLENSAAEWPYPAITTYRRGNHAVRGQRYRYIRYADGSEELYDHAVDPREWRNLAADPVHAAPLRRLAGWLPTGNAPDAAQASNEPRGGD